MANPGDIARGNKQVTTKTDKVDSAHLARELEAGRLKSIYIPTHKQEQFRRRYDLVKSLRRIKCHIKSMLLYYGIVLPETYDNINYRKDMIHWVYKRNPNHV